jgi:hypothetical protein
MKNTFEMNEAVRQDISQDVCCSQNVRVFYPGRHLDAFEIIAINLQLHQQCHLRFHIRHAYIIIMIINRHN